jgi:hypothetical protein
MFTFGPDPAAAAVPGQDQGGCARRFRGNARRNCAWRHRRVGGARLAYGPDRTKAPSAQACGGDTVLTGPLCERAALYGVVAEIEAFGLELLEVRRLPPV